MTPKFYRFYGRVIVVTLVLAVLAGFCGWMASASEPSFAKLVMEKYVGEASDLKTYSDAVEITDAFRSALLENVRGEIAVRVSKDGKAHLLVEGRAHVEGGAKPYGYKLEQGVLHVKVDHGKGERTFQFSWNGTEYGSASSELSLTLEVPASFHGDVELKTVNGELSLEGVTAERARLKAVNGDINVDVKSTVKSIEAETVNGDITIDATCFDQQLKSVAGDIEVAAPKNGSWDVNVKTISGDVENTLPRAGGATTATLQAKTISGDIKLTPGPKEPNR